MHQIFTVPNIIKIFPRYKQASLADKDAPFKDWAVLNNDSGFYDLKADTPQTPHNILATGYNKDRILHISTAGAGGTIFWRPNYEALENEGYNWKYLF